MDCQAIGRKVRIIHHQETQYHAEQPGKSEREEASIDYSGGKRVPCASGGTAIMIAGTTSGQMPWVNIRLQSNGYVSGWSGIGRRWAHET